MTVVKDTMRPAKVAPTFSRRSALLALVGLGALPLAAKATAPAPAPQAAPLPPAGTVCPDGGVISYLPDGKQVKIYSLDAEPKASPAKKRDIGSDEFARFLSGYRTEDCPKGIDPIDWRALLVAGQFYLGNPDVDHRKLWNAIGPAWKLNDETGEDYLFNKMHRLVCEALENRGTTLEDSFIEYLRLIGVENAAEKFAQACAKHGVEA